MKNPECTIASEEERAELLRHFPYYLTEAEEEVARRYFNQLVFFWATEEKNTRRCVCTGCMQGFFAHKETSPEFFKKHHNDRCECPNCGQAATLLAAGKYTNFNSLDSHIRGVQLSAYEGGLMVQAGWIERSFDDEDLGGTIDFVPWRRYYFAPGVRARWDKYASHWFGQAWTSDEWRWQDSVREAFQAQPYEREASYALLGYENIGKTSLRWCQYAEWFQDNYGAYVGGIEYEENPPFAAYFVTYIAEYTRRPQMEFLAKLGHMDILRDLVIEKKPQGDQLNWRADNPPGFFRLSKADYNTFKLREMQLPILRQYRQLHRRGLARSLEEFGQAKTSIGNVLFGILCDCAVAAGVSLERAENYIDSFRAGCSRGLVPRETIAGIWRDYLTAAKELRYDLKRDDVRMPRDLNERHDRATSSVKVKKDKKAMKAYLHRYGELVKQFEFTDAGLSVVVPTCMEDIVEEGKVLQHCVGGYAERHVRGDTCILFLRYEKFRSAPMATIELTVEENCSKLEIRQINSFKNERDGSASPKVKHATFLNKWLAWVHEGSKRDADGNPVLPEKKSKKKKEGTAA
jgi:hypothetical protein